MQCHSHERTYQLTPLTDSDHATSDQQDQEQQESQADPSSSQVGETALGEGAEIVGSRESSETSAVAQHAQPTTHRANAQLPHPVELTWMTHSKAVLIDRGFSDKVASWISEPQSQSIRDSYQGKWKIFCDYCTEKDTDPWEATIPQINEFLA